MTGTLRHTEMLRRWLAYGAAVTGVVGLWLLDVGVVLKVHNDSATNGFWTMSADQLYHVGLYATFLAVVVLGAAALTWDDVKEDLKFLRRPQRGHVNPCPRCGRPPCDL